MRVAVAREADTVVLSHAWVFSKTLAFNTKMLQVYDSL